MINYPKSLKSTVNKEEKMLLEVETAAKKENFLKRLGRLNPLPNNFQGKLSKPAKSSFIFNT